MIFGDPRRYYGDPLKVVVWDGTHIYRTLDIMASPVVWARIDSGISGTIYDIQGTIRANGNFAGWMLSSTGVWWCGDLEATSPSWSQVLSIGTIQASDATITGGTVVEVKCIATCQGEPDFCILATGPAAITNTGQDYAHSYFYHTHDNGANWTKVDVGLTGNSGHHYCFADRFGMQCAPDLVSGSPQVWAFRSTNPVGLGYSANILASTDGGHTFSKLTADLAVSSNGRDRGSLLVPFEPNDPAYVVAGTLGVANRPPIRIASGNWASSSALPIPTGYGGTNNDVTAYRRPGKKLGDVNHLIAWFRHSAEPENRLLESDDQGQNWSLLYDQNTNTQYCTPIPWPGNTQIWVWVVNSTSNVNLGTTPAVNRTSNYFSSVTNCNGNLSSLATWTAGLGGLLYIPKPEQHCQPTLSYSWNGIDLSPYIDEASLVWDGSDEDSTDLSATGQTAKAGRVGAQMTLSGNWNPTIDGYLGKGFFASDHYAAVVTLDGCEDGDVTYTWDDTYVSSWKINTEATGKITWSATLRHNGSYDREFEA